MAKHTDQRANSVRGKEEYVRRRTDQEVGLVMEAVGSRSRVAVMEPLVEDNLGILAVVCVISADIVTQSHHYLRIAVLQRVALGRRSSIDRLRRWWAIAIWLRWRRTVVLLRRIAVLLALAREEGHIRWFAKVG